MIRKLAAIAALSISATVAFATLEAQDFVDTCLDNAQTTISMQSCYDEALTRADTELNQVYQEAKQFCQGRDDAKSCLVALKSAELAWLKFRDQATKSAMKVSGNSSITTIEATSIKLDIVSNQIQLLKASITRDALASPGKELDKIWEFFNPEFEECMDTPLHADCNSKVEVAIAKAKELLNNSILKVKARCSSWEEASEVKACLAYFAKAESFGKTYSEKMRTYALSQGQERWSFGGKILYIRTVKQQTELFQKMARTAEESE